jgi:hypothetical protein
MRFLEEKKGAVFITLLRKERVEEPQMATAGWLASGGPPGHHSHGFPSSSSKKISEVFPHLFSFSVKVTLVTCLP